MSENVNDKLDKCTNSRQELRKTVRLTVWKRSGESRYPRALPPVLENFRRAFSPGPTDCPWVSEDVLADGGKAFAHVAVNGLQTLSERVYPETQFGLSEGRSTMDVIFSLRQL